MNVTRHFAPEWCAKLADFYVFWKNNTHFPFGFLLQEKFCYYEKQTTKITLCSNPLIQKADLTYAIRQPFIKGREGVSDAFLGVLIKGTLFRASEPPTKKGWRTQHGQGLTFEPIGNDGAYGGGFKALGSARYNGGWSVYIDVFRDSHWCRYLIASSFTCKADDDS